MKKIIRLLIIALSVSFCLTGCNDKQPRQLYEKTGSFSYTPPAGWQASEFPGVKYRISHGSDENGFSPNINVIDENFSGSLTEYVEGNIRNINKFFSKVKLIKQEKIKTTDNLDAVILIIENEQEGKNLRQTFLFIGPEKKKYVITCTASADGGTKYDTIFSESLKTFRIHK